MGDPRIDWSSLDPSRDTERWNRLVESIADRALAHHKQRLTVSYQLLAWFGPVLAIAATVALVISARVLLAHSQRINPTTRCYERAYAVAQWAEVQEHSTTYTLQLLEETNADQ